MSGDGQVQEQKQPEIVSPDKPDNDIEDFSPESKTDSTETGLNLLDSLDANSLYQVGNQKAGETIESFQPFGNLEIGESALADNEGLLEKLGPFAGVSEIAKNHNDRYGEMKNNVEPKTYTERGDVKGPNGSSYVINENGLMTHLTIPQENGKAKQAEYSNIKYDENNNLKEYTRETGHKFTRTGPLDENGFAKWQCSWTSPENGQTYNTKFKGAGSDTFNAKITLNNEGNSILIGEPTSDSGKAFEGNMYFRSAEGNLTKSTPVKDDTGKVTGIDTDVTIADETTKVNSDIDNQGKLGVDYLDLFSGKVTDALAQRKENREKRKDGARASGDKPESEDVGDNSAISADDDLEITFGEDSDTADGSNDLEISDIKKLYDKYSSSAIFKESMDFIKDTVVPHAMPMLDTIANFGKESNILDNLSTQSQATKIASDHNDRFMQSIENSPTKTYGVRGEVNNADGSSFEVNKDGKLSRLTLPFEDGQDKPFEYKNIKYDQNGDLKEYQLHTGHKVSRTSQVDENGFANWKCTWQSPQNGRIYNTNFPAAGSSTFNANIRIDDKGASLLIGEPITEANKEFQGTMYYRRANGDQSTSKPVLNDDNKVTGLETEMNVDGETKKLASSFNDNGELKPEFQPIQGDFFERLAGGVNSLLRPGGAYEQAKESVKAAELADIQDDRYEKMLAGGKSKVFEAAGAVEQEDGSSFEVGEDLRIKSFTHAEVGDQEPYKITDIKHDENGHLKSYIDQQGFLFQRTGEVDNKGFGTWQASKDGVVHNYTGTGTKQFRANMMIDENGLSKLIGEPAPGQQKHDHAGTMYWRSSDSSTVHSSPESNSDRETIGIKSDIKLSNGESYTRSSLFDESGQLDSKMNLTKVEKEVEKNEKVEEIKDKIESLEDPIRELTDAFKKFEKVGSLQISRDRDGSYKADLSYNGPRWMPSQFKGPVTYKKGSPVWSNGMTLNPDISFNFRSTDDGVMIDRMSGVFSSANWRGINASGPQHWMQLGKYDNGTPYMMANTTSTGSKRVLFWTFSRTENNTNTFTARNFKHGTGMRNMLSDSSAIDGMNSAMKLFENADISNIAMTRPDRNNPGNFDVGVRFNEAKHIKVNEKLEGPLELDSIKLAKDLKFRIQQGADGPDRDRNPDSVEIDASGITANVQIGENGKLLPVQPKKVTIAKDANGRSILQMHIEADQLKRLKSADLKIDLKDLDNVQSGKLTLVNVPLLKVLSGQASQGLKRIANQGN